MSKPSLTRTLLRWSASIVGAVALLMLAAWLLVPRWLAGPGARAVSDALGRDFSIAEVRFHPWALSLDLEGLRIAGAKPGDAPLLTVASVQTALSPRSLWHLSPVLSSLQIEQPVLRLSRLTPGHYDVDDLLARLSRPKPRADDKPPQFGLYNIGIHQGQVLLDDRPLARRHEISQLQLELPFLSTLSADVQVAVQPKLSGKLNGVDFGSDAELLPFSRTQDAKLDLALQSLDLEPYVAYLPEALPLRLQRGRLDAKLSLQFSEVAGQAPRLKLSGSLGLRDFALATPAGLPWLKWQALSVELKDVQPLQQQVQLGAIRWNEPVLSLRTDPAGQLWLPVTSSADNSKAAPAAPWRFGFDRLELAGAALDWNDASTEKPSLMQLTDLQATAGALQWPMTGTASTPLTLNSHMTLAGAQSAAATLSGKGNLGTASLSVAATWQDLTLESLAPWLKKQFPGSVQGLASGQVDLALKQPFEPGAAQRTSLALRDLRVAKFALATAARAEPLISVADLHLDEASVDLATRQVQAGELLLQQPLVRAARNADGHWEYEALISPAAAAPAQASAPAAPSPWRLQARGLRVGQGTVRLQDALAPQPESRAVQVDQIEARLQNLAWPPGPEAMPASLSLSLGRAEDKRPSPSRLQWKGQVLLSPLSASGHLQVDKLPLQLLDPYLDPAWGVQLRRAELGVAGDFALAGQPQGLQAEWKGDVQLANLRVNQASWQEGRRVIGEELLSWQTLDLTGMGFTSKPGSPPQLNVAKARLDEYYVRLNVNEQGHFNISDLGPRADAAKAPAPAPVHAASSPALLLSVGQTQFSKGQVDFSDHFIRPNYTAQLSALEGSLGAFASAKPAMAPLSLRGKVAGTGDLTIEGQLNPAASPLTMNLKAKARDIELSPLSPYAAKYAGYAIERGKLSTQVEYRIDAGGLLQASNKITLDQLTFGDRVESPEATKLPVLLAVALLKDSNGVIDVDLPVSGSINDPDFSIAGLVFKLIGNLIGKALTAPFSLFSGGGNTDVSHAAFAPGGIAPAKPEQLDAVAKMLSERPGLVLTITGWADAGTDAEPLLTRLLLSATDEEHRRQLRRQPKGAEPAPAHQAITDAQLLELAGERATVIRDALIARGIPNSRLFLGSPHLTDAVMVDWVPYADLRLSAQ